MTLEYLGDSHSVMLWRLQGKKDYAIIAMTVLEARSSVLPYRDLLASKIRKARKAIIH